jgi:hypothetical protein
VEKMTRRKKKGTNTVAEQQQDYLSQTNEDHMDIIRTDLDRRSLRMLAATSKRHYALFQPLFIVNALWQAVVKGNQHKVERLPNASMLLYKADVTDHSERHFKSITAYQYALWALDARMIKAIEDRVQGIPGKAGEGLRAALSAQRKELKEQGLNYTYNGRMINETQYNPEPLFQAYITLDNFKERPPHGQDPEVFCRRMLNVVYELSLQQRLMPAHMIQELCDPTRPFLKFQEKSLVRKAHILSKGVLTPIFPIREKMSLSKEEFSNQPISGGDDDLNIINSLFLIARGESEHALGGQEALGVLMQGWAKRDLQALQILCFIRTKQLEKGHFSSEAEVEFKGPDF